MRSLTAKSESLRLKLKRVWTALGMIAIAVSTLAFLLLGYIDYRKTMDRIEDDLVAKAVPIERRISAELLVSRTSVTENVILDLSKYYEIKKIELNKAPTGCGEAYCSKISDGLLSVQINLSEPTELYSSVKLGVAAPSFFSSFKFNYFLAAFIPILGLFLYGIWIQRKILNKNLVKPIDTLVGTAYRGEEIPSYWPSEFRELSERLDDAFRERDQAMVGQLASGVLHDMKTLLHSLSVATELAEESRNESPELYSKRLESLLKVSAIQIPKMKTIIESVLDGSRVIEPALQLISLKSTIEGAVKVNDDFAKARNVKVDLAIEEFAFSHDQAQLERAVFNLVKNGIEATDSAKVERRVLVSAFQSGDNAQIIVEDSGSGFKIDPKRLFKNVRTTKTHGTGLGLLVSRKIIEAHGGSISADQSRELGGAKFVISIPNQGAKV